MSCLTFGVASDIKHYGYTEDGATVEGEVFFILAEDRAGNRWVLDRASFDSIEPFDNEDCFGFRDVLEEARSRAEALCAKIVAKGVVDLDAHWHSSYPAYGSSAYQQYGQAEQVFWEKELG